MIHNRERGSREARLATVRLGLFAITLFFAGTILAGLIVIYQGIAFFNDEVEESTYTFGDYLGAVGPTAGIAIAITVIAAFVLYFVYARLMDRMVNTPE